MRPKTAQIITTEMLLDILLVSRLLDHFVFQALYYFSFFLFLRLSNLLPYTMASFDLTRQLCRGDLIFSPETIVVVTIWSKTLQH